MSRVKQLFAIAKRSVDDELNNGSLSPDIGGQAYRNQPNQSNQQDGNGEVRCATASQPRAIRSICQRQGSDADQLAHERFAVSSVGGLTLREYARMTCDTVTSSPDLLLALVGCRPLASHPAMARS